MGLDLGLEMAGFESRFACELDPVARTTISINKPSLPIAEDIMTLDVNRIRMMTGLGGLEETPLVCGGPPCQSFSTAGKRKGLDDIRGGAMVKFLDLATELKPRCILVENVKGLLSAKLDGNSGGVFKFILQYLNDRGYATSYALYNAADFGVPQRRERVIILASLGACIPPLRSTHSSDPSTGLLAWVTFRDAVKGLPDSPKEFFKFSERASKVFSQIKAGQNWKALPLEEQKAAMGGAFFSGGGKTGFFRRVAWDKPVPTLVTSPAMKATSLAHPEEDRYLSIQEYMRLQCFPDDWRIAGGVDDRYRQIGNAVPVLLGKVVGEAVMAHMLRC